MMFLRSPLRLTATAFLVAVLALLVCAAPSSQRASVASAQSCVPGTSYNVFTGQSCSGVNPFVSCGFGSTYGCSPYSGTSGCSGYYSCYNSAYGCSGYSAYSSCYNGAYGYNGTYGCSGYSYGYSGGCGGCGSSLFVASCGGCGSSLFGSGCGGCGSSVLYQSCGAIGGGGCAGVALQAGQSCSNGVVTCTPPQGGAAVPCGSGVQGCPPTVITPLCRTTQPVTTAQPVRNTSIPQASGNMTCPGGGFVSAGQSCTTPAQTASASGQSGQSTGVFSAAPFGFTVSLGSGWNLISGPQGTTLNAAGGSIYTFQAGDTNYESIPASTPLKAGAGYWVNLGQATQIALPPAFGGSVTVTLPAGQFVMIGNPGISTATVTGADQVLVYNPSTNNYSSATQLQPGQGAWAFSAAGGQATIKNTGPGQS